MPTLSMGGPEERALAVVDGNDGPFALASVGGDSEIKGIRVTVLEGAELGHLVIDDTHGMSTSTLDDGNTLLLTGAISTDEAQALLRSVRFQRTDASMAEVTLELRVASALVDGDLDPAASTSGTHRVSSPLLVEQPAAASCVDYISWKAGRTRPGASKKYRTHRVVRGPEGLAGVQFGPVYVDDHGKCKLVLDGAPGEEAADWMQASDTRVEVHFSDTSDRPDFTDPTVSRTVGGLGTDDGLSAMPFRFQAAWHYASGQPETELHPTSTESVFVHTRLTWTGGDGVTYFASPAYERISVKEVADAPVFELSATSRLSAFGFTRMYCADVVGRSVDGSESAASDQLSHCLDDPSGGVWTTELSAAPLSLHGRFVFSERLPFLGGGIDISTVVLNKTDLGNDLGENADGSSVAPIQATAGPDFRFDIAGQPMHLMPYGGWMVTGADGSAKVRFTTGVAIITEIVSLFKSDSRSANTDQQSGSGDDSSDTVTPSEASDPTDPDPDSTGNTNMGGA